MSVSVPLPELAEELGRRSMPAYVMTSTGAKAPHASAAFLRFDGRVLIAGCGDTMAGNLATQPSASVIVPPDEPDGYTLIVDATAEIVDGDVREVHLTPTKAVLHRPGVAADGSACGHDCKSLRD